MSDNLSHEVGYEPPNKEFIRNSLLYGLSSENEADSTRSSSQSYDDSYSDLSRILNNKGKIERALIQFSFNNKRRIKSIPWLGKFALSVKRYLLKKNLSMETPGFSRLDLSGIMGLEVNDFINQLYILALGRAPDNEGWSNTKYLLCSGAPREAVAFMICTSKEFANRAQVAYLDEYRKVFWHYRLRRSFQRLPLVGYIWAIAAIPRRIYRLEVEERIHHVDTQFIERQRFEALSADLHSSQNRIDALYAENSDLRSNFNSLLSQNKTLHTQVESLNAEIKAGFKDLSQFKVLQAQIDTINTEIKAGFETFSAQNTAINSHLGELSNLATSFITNAPNHAEILAALQIANQNIIQANVKLDETGILINNAADRNKPIFYSLPGGVTAVQTNEYIIGVPSEEWRLAVFLSKYGFFEFGTEKYFQSILKEGMNVVDVGAYLGIYTLHALAAGCWVYSYEPTPQIFNILVNNIGINGFEPTHRASPYNYAVSDKEGEAKFSIIGNGLGQMNSLFSSNPEDKTIEVRTVCLDDHLVKLDHVDIAKIDVEGAEPLVLEGMKKIIAKNPGIKIIMEFAPAHLRRGGKEPLDFVDKIREMGLDIHLIHAESGEILEINDEELCAVNSVNILLMRPG